MTVQELIDELEKIQDRKKDVVSPQGYLVEKIFIDENGDIKISHE